MEIASPQEYFQNIVAIASYFLGRVPRNDRVVWHVKNPFQYYRKGFYLIVVIIIILLFYDFFSDH